MTTWQSEYVNRFVSALKTKKSGREFQFSRPAFVFHDLCEVMPLTFSPTIMSAASATQPIYHKIVKILTVILCFFQKCQNVVTTKIHGIWFKLLKI